MEPESNQQRQSGPRKSAWAWPVAWIATVLIVVGGGIFVLISCFNTPVQVIEKTGQLAEKVGRGMAHVAAAFNQGTITTTFTSFATAISGNQYLQFATLSQTERFTRDDVRSTGFGYIPLPEVVVEASAPVTYTYYLDLNDHWQFHLQNGRIEVTAPDIKYNPPAVDVSRMTYEVKKDSIIRKFTPGADDSRQVKDALTKSITPLTYEKAKENVSLVRETGRRQTQLFVQDWLAKTFADGTNFPVTVRFRSEIQNSGADLPRKENK